ncbi:hypothetical protein [Marinobacter sp. MIT932201]|uniref:hypothetical protein n=1 Tax=Marinobacter sp. MIT932201 TaxID=3096995 RepID=UPI00399C2FE4
MVKIKTGKESRVCQGDIVRDVEYIEYFSEKDGNIEVSKIIFPLSIVLTQDCDLSQDYKFRWSKASTPNEDKWLMSVIVAPIYNLEHVFSGEHLSELEMTMAQISRNKTPGKNLRNNETPRYHFLEFPDRLTLPPSVIDFKHYFSVNVAYLKKHKRNNFVCQVSDLYREDISHRFASYLSRIGLP